MPDGVGRRRQGPPPGGKRCGRPTLLICEKRHHCYDTYPGPRLIAQPFQPTGQESGPPPVTVHRLMPSRAQTAVLLCPSVQASTIRARSANPCPVFRRVAHPCSVRRSAPDNTSGGSLLSPISPADRGPRALSRPTAPRKATSAKKLAGAARRVADPRSSPITDPGEQLRHFTGPDLTNGSQ